MNTPRTNAKEEVTSLDGIEAKEPLQVRLPVRVKRQFKAHAALRGCEPNQLFVEVWQHYQRTAVKGVDNEP